MERNTSELLNQLKIDRDAPVESRPFSPLVLASAIAVTFAIGLTAGALIFSGDDATESAVPPSLTAVERNADPVLDQPPIEATTSGAPADLETPVSAAIPGESILSGSGYITARRMATVSAEVMGLIRSVDVEEGMSVKPGQVLATLDASKAQVNLDLALARVKVLQARESSVRANLAEAQRQEKRFRGLIDRDFSSKAQLSQTRANVESLTANLASAQADIEVARLDAQRAREILDDHTIRAPFSGVVTQKNAQPGEIVAPSSAGGGFTRTGICTIVDMASLEIEVDVNEAYIGRVTAGQPVRANLDAYPDWDIPARVIAIIPTADRARATVRVRIGLETKDTRILPDMGVKVAFLKNVTI